MLQKTVSGHGTDFASYPCSISSWQMLGLISFMWGVKSGALWGGVQAWGRRGRAGVRNPLPSKIQWVGSTTPLCNLGRDPCLLVC